jgi:branched-chain amino acid transport system ATP-binding protein
VSYLIGENMTGGYGGADILKGCTVDVDEGEIAVIVGPNGAGKSTAMRAMLGMLELNSGSVRFRGKEITGLSTQARIAEGIAFVPQTNNVFVNMTVLENLEMGAFLRTDDFSESIEQVFELFPILAEKQVQLTFRRTAPTGRFWTRLDVSAPGVDAGRADCRCVSYCYGRSI